MSEKPKSIPTKCPGCGSTRINWKSQAGNGDRASWMCGDCKAIGRMGWDHPEITRGREMAHRYEGIHCMDQAIISLSCNVQIGILRERQDDFLEKFNKDHPPPEVK